MTDQKSPRTHAATVAALTALAALACDTGVDNSGAIDAGGTDAPASTECAQAAEHSDLDWIQAEIFDMSCNSVTVCHKGSANSAGGLSLDPGRSAEAMIGVSSGLFPDWVLVEPGDPEASYLMVICGAVEGPLNDGLGTMPYNAPLLCSEKLGAMSRWIAGLPSTADAGPTSDASAPDAGNLDAAN